MNYNVYLFICLLKLYDKEFNELEYDLQFNKAPKLYDDFSIVISTILAKVSMSAL